MPLLRSKIDQLCPGEIALIGIPFDEHGSFMKGPAKAPELIVNAIESPSANYFTENLVNLEDHPRFKWAGNVEFKNYLDISSPIEKILAKDAIPFSLGGDHSVTYPIIKAFTKKYGSLNILHFDAHGDLYDELGGNRFSHACPFARIMESGLAHRLVQIGVRTYTQHQEEQAEKFGVEVHHMKDLDLSMKIYMEGPVYLTFDLDVLDPAFAPGLSHHEPGGMNVRDAITLIQSLNLEIVGADLVEYNPLRDINGVTAMVAAKLVKEITDRILVN